MKSQRSNIIKEYKDKPFILTPQKLARIVEISNERMARFQNRIQSSEEFKIGLTNGKEITLNCLREVLSLDNSKKNPINQIEFSLVVMNDTDQIYTINVSFNNTEYRWSFNSIQIRASASDITWLQETVGALEEQVERTIPNEFIYGVRRLFTSDLLFLLSS
jgi:hypothetical protein